MPPTPRTRDDIRDALSDEAALICTLYGECRAEPIEGQIAVASVIRNRALHPRWWGHGYLGVCLKSWQFSCWWEQNSNSLLVYQLAEALIDHDAIHDAVTVAQLEWIAEGILAGKIGDRSNRADHYVTTALLQSGQAPSWAAQSTPVAVVHKHTFFRLELT